MCVTHFWKSNAWLYNVPEALVSIGSPGLPFHRQKCVLTSPTGSLSRMERVKKGLFFLSVYLLWQSCDNRGNTPRSPWLWLLTVILGLLFQQHVKSLRLCGVVSWSAGERNWKENSLCWFWLYCIIMSCLDSHKSPAATAAAAEYRQ